MMSTAKPANIGFRQVVQLFGPPTNPARHGKRLAGFVAGICWVLV